MRDMFLIDCVGREVHSQPHLYTATMVGYRGHLLIAVLGPVLAALRRILGKLFILFWGGGGGWSAAGRDGEKAETESGESRD
jgi:hypothetical protein